jgi:hypothetical protein
MMNKINIEDELKKLRHFADAGVITEKEYAARRRRLLNNNAIHNNQPQPKSNRKKSAGNKGLMIGFLLIFIVIQIILAFLFL